MHSITCHSEILLTGIQIMMSVSQTQELAHQTHIQANVHFVNPGNCFAHRTPYFL